MLWNSRESIWKELWNTRAALGYMCGSLNDAVYDM
jgi:hypothetical protein